MKKTMHYFLILLCVIMISQTLSAQAIQPDSLKWQLVKDWERAKTYTNEYLAAMPADKYGARAVDSIRSFSEQMLHLAGGNIGLISNGTGKPRIFSGFNMEKSAGAQSRDSVTYYVNASYDYAIDAIKNMDASQLGERVKRGPFNETRFAWLMKAFEHQGHHRGQCTIYIRLQGIKPPNEKLF
ncbi:MAG: hypothetical protein NVSMB63_06330 [Sediminibacterium sp.]